MLNICGDSTYGGWVGVIVLFYLFYVKLNADFFFSKRSTRLENLAINCLSATTQTCAMVVLT